jgi:hypothetical protein
MRRVLAVLSVLLGTVTMGLVTTPVTTAVAGAAAPTTTIYDSTDPTATSLVSQCYECAQVTQIGNQVSFGGGNRTLSSVTVQMESWACESGDAYGQSGPCISPDRSFAQPMTLNLYRVGNDGVSVGSLLASVPITAQVLYRPTSDPIRCTTDSEWWDGTTCNHGIVSPVTFPLSHVTVPDKVIYGIAVNTSDYGNPPVPCSSQPTGCPADSLNVGLTTTDGPQPTVGADPVVGAIYENTGYAPFYCDNGTTGTFRADLPLDHATDPSDPQQSCWSANGPYTSINGGNNGYGPAPYYVPAVSFTTEASCTMTCYVDPAGNDANSGSADSPFATIQHAVTAVSSGGTVHVAAGTYDENVHITQPVTLLGANAGTPGTSGSRGAESVISTSNGGSSQDLTVQVSSPGVTVEGFTIQQTAPTTCPTCAAFGVQVDPGATGATVTDDIVGGMSSTQTAPTKGGNPIGIDVSGNGGGTPDNVTVSDNLIEHISALGTQHISGLGIEVGDSTVTHVGSGLVISGNHITDVSSAAWGAYGIILNRPTTGTQIVGNTIDAVHGGGWAHAVGLEGNTASATIADNAISGVSAGSSDSVDIFTDATNNSGVTTTSFSDNSFGGGTAGGVGSVSTGTLDAAGNWWGCASGPNTAGCAATGGTGTVTVSPWIVAYTPDPAHAGRPGFWPTAVTTSTSPVITSANSATFQAGAANTFTVTASGIPAPAISESNTDTLPSGVTFDPGTGVLSGTPTAPGTYTLHFTAHNGSGADGAQTFSLSVAGISSPASAQTVQRKHLRFTVTTTGHPAAVVGQTGMPAWMTLKDGKGASAGTAKLGGVGPSGGGNYTFTLTADYGGGHVATQQFTVHVFGINSAAAANFSRSGPPTQSFTITTVGNGAPVTISMHVGAKQAGLSFVDNGDGTATVSGKPGAGAATQVVTVKAVSGAFTASQKLAIGISS